MVIAASTLTAARIAWEAGQGERAIVEDNKGRVKDSPFGNYDVILQEEKAKYLRIAKNHNDLLDELGCSVREAAMLCAGFVAWKDLREPQKTLAKMQLSPLSAIFLLSLVHVLMRDIFIPFLLLWQHHFPALLR